MSQILDFLPLNFLKSWDELNLKTLFSSHGKSRQNKQLNNNLWNLSLLHWLQPLQALYIENSVIKHQLYDPLLFL